VSSLTGVQADSSPCAPVFLYVVFRSTARKREESSDGKRPADAPIGTEDKASGRRDQI